MRYSPDFLAKSPESALVGLARTGNRNAFAELIGRRQTWIRNLMRRCAGDAESADDLAQQVFLQAWRTIHQLQDVDRFAPWLKRLAINTWLQQRRKNDPLRGADEHEESDTAHSEAPGVAMDLDRALGTLPDDARLCIVLGYHEGMTHGEIADFTGMPLGTVKSHIRRGTRKLRETLAAYAAPIEAGT
ncbi:MAG: RNA polymerase sigma factor [Proteobacteria bacterium]|nr:RNA polymerase sigma factor [Pseudomonadota bacterium]